MWDGNVEIKLAKCKHGVVFLQSSQWFIPVFMAIKCGLTIDNLTVKLQYAYMTNATELQLVFYFYLFIY